MNDDEGRKKGRKKKEVSVQSLKKTTFLTFLVNEKGRNLEKTIN